jgi:hypothetical protein
MKKILAIMSNHPRLFSLGISFGLAFAFSIVVGSLSTAEAFTKGWEEGAR